MKEKKYRNKLNDYNFLLLTHFILNFRNTQNSKMFGDFSPFDEFVFVIPFRLYESSSCNWNHFLCSTSFYIPDRIPHSSTEHRTASHNSCCCSTVAERMKAYMVLLPSIGIFLSSFWYLICIQCVFFFVCSFNIFCCCFFPYLSSCLCNVSI